MVVFCSLKRADLNDSSRGELASIANYRLFAASCSRDARNQLLFFRRALLLAFLPGGGGGLDALVQGAVEVTEGLLERPAWG